MDFCVDHQLDGSATGALLALLQPQTGPDKSIEHIEDQLRIQLQSIFQLMQQGLDHKPCCLLIEDIHLAETGLMDAIAKLANLTGSRPLLLLLSARSDGEPLDPAWRGQFFSAQLTLMELNVFNRQESRQFAMAYASLSDDYRQRCLLRSQGHPLYLEQLLSAADESLDVLPDSILKSIQYHLDRLDIKHLRVAQTLALAGPNIETALLEFLQIDQESLDSLVREQVIVRRDERLSFRHQLMHEVIVQNTLPSRRLALHEKLARYFKLRDTRRYAEHLIHTDAANRVDVMLQSVEAQIGQGRYEEANRLIELALSSLDEKAFKPLRLPQVKVLHRLGHNVKALQLCTDHLETCDNVADCCHFSIEKGRVELLLDRLDDAETSLQQALELAVKQGYQKSRAEIHLLLGNTAFSANRLQQCLRHHKQALELAREQGHDDLVRQALGGLGDAHYSLGRMATAAGYYQQAVEQDSPGSTQAGNRAMLGYCQIFLLEMDLAEHNLTESIRQAERLYDLRGEALARNTESIRLIELGEYRAVLEQTNKALAISQMLGSTRFVLDNLSLLGLVTFYLGNADQARQILQSAWDQCTQEFEGFIGAQIAAYMARACTAPEDQQYWLDEGERLLTTDALSHNHLHFYHQAIEISLANSNPEKARDYADKLQRYTRDESLAWADKAIQQARQV
jgi:tetratricopeptide (TPR) repeat protein